MSKKVLILLALIVLVLTGCFHNAVTTGPDEEVINYDETVNQPDNVILPDSNRPTDQTASSKIVTYVFYTNKAIGYTIERPDQWYWRHYTRGEIGDSNPLVDDYFIADPNPLPKLGSEYLGQMVIEASSRPLSDFADSVRGLSTSQIIVASLSAIRYAGFRTNQLVENQKVIEYHFTKGSRTFRIIYNKQDSSEEAEQIFEHLVESFSFEVGE
ncbi:MAG: hypothetical protein ABIJ81_00965 [Patescibacteria group bacterium]